MDQKTRDAKVLKPLIYNPPMEALNIVHQDEHILVLSKPPKLLSVPGRDPAHHDSLETRAKIAFPQALLVHRLDMETSGLMIMAMNKAAQANLGKQFERRRVKKTYIARVWGHVEGQSGVIDLPLRCDWPNRPLQMVCHEHGKPAQTHWTVLSRDEIEGVKSTLMRLTPHTGRSHQLRVHMLALGQDKGGHPILGDDFYAHDDALNAAPRLCLHARKLELFHPDGGAEIVFEDEVVF